MELTFEQPEFCERWGVLELTFAGHADGNPFIDYNLIGQFTGSGDDPRESMTVEGFYDGDGIYKVRFMPSFEGMYTYEVEGSFSENRYRGTFQVLPPSEGNHGPVQVVNQFHFAYVDGTPYYPVGTTCYGFALQDPDLVEETFSQLEATCFNKMRFCLFPKHYDFCLYDPACFPYEGTPMDASILTRENFSDYNGAPEGNDWDFTRFNPAFFQLYDQIIARLGEMGIEADMILFHAYDRWGFSQMPMEQNLLYLRYVVARYGAYRNVWWALANEYELLSHLSLDDWDQMGTYLGSLDSYHCLLSIHNCETFYDYTRPWITHCSSQRTDHHKTTESTDDLRAQFGKPIVWDEVGYEGDLPHCWGNFTPEELVRRAWEAAIRGGYCGHGETYLSDDNILWWAHGGRLHGESPARFRFLRDFLDDVPGLGLKLAHLRDDVHFQWDDYVAIPEDSAFEGSYYFFYYSIWRPSFRQIWIDDDTWFDIDVVDTWNMTITPAGRHKGRFEIPLPVTQYMGIRARRSKNQADEI